MTSQQAIVIQILPNIHTQNVEKSNTKCGVETSLRSFSGKLLSISLDQYSKVFYSLFLLNPKLRAIKIY